jgi:hypothetical protein
VALYTRTKSHSSVSFSLKPNKERRRREIKRRRKQRREKKAHRKNDDGQEVRFITSSSLVFEHIARSSFVSAVSSDSLSLLFPSSLTIHRCCDYRRRSRRKEKDFCTRRECLLVAASFFFEQHTAARAPILLSFAFISRR